MNNSTYMTLAAARLADPQRFDSMIRKAVFAAAHEVGRETVLRALGAPKAQIAEAEQKLAA